MALEAYRRRRDFSRTPEPEGRVAPRRGWSFVVHQHAATHLHYDFRLELDGVLLSWAVPKGPHLDPAVKRLAVRTEDHPVEYGSFEGVIPRGEYGAGTVMVWDHGVWEPQGDPRRDLQRGHLRFVLHGHKLGGRWHLVRSQRKDSDQETWLLLKGKDAWARQGEAGEITAQRQESSLSARTLAEIAADPDRVWYSQGEDDHPAPPPVEALDGARRRAMPARLRVPSFRLERTPPAGSDWLHELDYGGPRVVAWIADGRAAVLQADGTPMDTPLPSTTRTLLALPVREAILLGQLTVLDRSGRPDPAALARVLETGDDGHSRLILSDLLYLDGTDLRAVALVDRKTALRRLLEVGRAAEGRLRYADHVEGHGPEVHARACELGVPAVVSRPAEGTFDDGGWIRVACRDARPTSDPVHAPPLELPTHVRLTHPDKVMDPASGVTKRELAAYYLEVGALALPHLENRLLTMVRCPDGVGGQCFFARHPQVGFPAAIRPVAVQEKGETTEYVTIDGMEGLLSLVQMGVLEIHPWGSRADRPDRPDRLVFDLDPDDELPWAKVAEGARIVRTRLDELGLRSFVKVTGGKGLHVVVPITRRVEYGEVKRFCAAVATDIARRHPERFVAVMSKARRRGLIYLDYLRNAFAATSVAPYSTRARTDLPVALPLEWDELEQASERPVFPLRRALEKIASRPRDPWSEMATHRQSITAAMKRAVGP